MSPTVKLESRGDATIQEILESRIDWGTLPSSYEIQPTDMAFIKKFSDPALTLTEKFRMLDLCNMLIILRILEMFKAIDPGNTYTKIGYLVVVLHEIVREDFSRYEYILELGHHKYRKAVHVVLHKLMRSLPVSRYADKAAILASGLIVHDECFRDTNAVVAFVELLIEQVTKCSNTGVLHCLANLLKLKQLRSCLWNITGVHIIIRANLNSEKIDSANQYLAVFCVWLYTLGAKYIFHLNESGLLQRVFELLHKEPRSEKIVRLSLEIIENSVLADQDETIDTMIKMQIGEALDILEFQKWKSKELYTRIQQVKKTYLDRVKTFSTYQRYLTELQRNKLVWGYLHSEEFWAENVMEFEVNEFAAIKQLIQIIQGNDADSVAVACNDLGEFARLYPTGKKILAKLEAKTHLLKLMKHDNREIQKQSLLAIQKIMLQNWQQVA